MPRYRGSYDPKASRFNPDAANIVRRRMEAERAAAQP
jgi:hypothetical protein